MTPGRNPSTRTSASAASSRARASPGWVFQVEHDTALARIDLLEEPFVVAHGVAARRFDLEHVGPKATRSDVA